MLVIDRFEGDFAVVVTDRGTVNIPKADLPGGAKEGDVLGLVLKLQETSEVKDRIEGLMNRLFID